MKTKYAPRKGKRGVKICFGSIASVTPAIALDLITCLKAYTSLIISTVTFFFACFITDFCNSAGEGGKKKTAVVTFTEADWQWLAGRMKHLPLARARASARARSRGDIAPPNATSLCKEEHRRHSRRRQKSYFARPHPTPAYNYSKTLAGFSGFKPWSQVPCISARGYPKTLLLSSTLCLPPHNQQGFSPSKNRK